jgi:predicted nuclease of predicted toxin-antitoxin system
MSAFLIDEDLPRSLARELRSAGHDAVDVRDVGLRGRPDSEIFQYAVTRRLVLLTADMGFANVLQFEPHAHVGIVIARFPNEVSTTALNMALLAALNELSETDFVGNTVVVEPGRVRMRRKRQ